MNTIVILGAMPSELADIRNMLGKSEVKSVSGFDFHINEYKGKKLINVCSGIGKVNAAMCTQTAIDNFSPDCVINAGIAGGMNNAIKVCDIVVSSEVLPHDVDPHLLRDYPPYCCVFKADEKLIEAAEKATAELGAKSFRGRVVSGEQFVTNSEIKAGIQEAFAPFAIDMESAAVGHCCFLNKTPFVTVRCISDNADDDGDMSYDEFEKIAAKRVAAIVIKMTESL